MPSLDEIIIQSSIGMNDQCMYVRKGQLGMLGGFELTLIVDIELSKCRIKQSLPKSICLYISYAFCLQTKFLQISDIP